MCYHIIISILAKENNMEFGLNLYSIRTEVDTPEKFLATAQKLKDMGYSFLQCSGCPYDVELYKKMTERTGMPVVLTHVGMNRIIDETDALMAEHEAFGCRSIGLGAMPGDCLKEDDAVVEAVAKLNVAAQRMQDKGFAFFYHNHNFEFRRMADGRTIMEYMIDEAPAINFTFDTYWAQVGGVSILEYVRKLAGRIKCVHLKDYEITKSLGYRIAPVGNGNINFHDVIPAMIQSGAEYFLVEQDNAPDFDDTLGQVKQSIDYLKKNF